MSRTTKHWNGVTHGVALIGVLAVGVLLAGAGNEPQGELLWQDRHLGGGLTRAIYPVVAGGRLVVAGVGTDAAGRSDWLVRAYDPGSGSLLWQDHYDMAGGHDRAYMAVTDGARVFVGGSVLRPGVARFSMVRSYDAATGSLFWEDLFDWGGGYNEVSADAMAVDGGRVFAGLICRRPGTLDMDWVVRTCDAATGALLWQDVYDGGEYDHVVSVAARENRVFASGRTTTMPGAVLHFTVRAYDAASGALLWQDQLPGAPANELTFDVAWSVKAMGSRVFATGVRTEGSESRFILRAYDAASGSLLWQDVLDSGGEWDEGRTVVLDSEHVFVVGQGGAECNTTPASNCNLLVRAYDQQTGELKWTREIDAGGDDMFVRADVRGDRLVAAGLRFRAKKDSYIYEHVIKAFDTRTGATVWNDIVMGPEPGISIGAVAVADEGAFVAGGVNKQGMWLLRAYATR